MFWSYFLINRAVSDKKLGKEIGIAAGVRLNPYSTEESLRKIEELYIQAGHPKAKVTLLEGDKKDDKNLVFLINEGSFESQPSPGGWRRHPLPKGEGFREPAACWGGGR